MVYFFSMLKKCRLNGRYLTEYSELLEDSQLVYAVLRSLTDQPLYWLALFTYDFELCVVLFKLQQ